MLFVTWFSKDLIAQNNDCVGGKNEEVASDSLLVASSRNHVSNVKGLFFCQAAGVSNRSFAFASGFVDVGMYDLEARVLDTQRFQELGQKEFSAWGTARQDKVHGRNFLTPPAPSYQEGVFLERFSTLLNDSKGISEFYWGKSC